MNSNLQNNSANCFIAIGQAIDQDFERAFHIFLSFLKVNKSTHFKTDFTVVEVCGSSFTLTLSFLVRLIHSIQRILY